MPERARRHYMVDHYLLSLSGAIIAMEQVELAERVLKFIEEHPDLHDQQLWMSESVKTLDEAVSCGTTGCFAGWVAVLDGHRIVENEDYCRVDARDGRSVGNWASDRLGLPLFGSVDSHPFGAHVSIYDLGLWVEAMRIRAEQLEVAAGMRPAVTG